MLLFNQLFDKKGLTFISLIACSALFHLIAFFYFVNIALTPVSKPITPANSKPPVTSQGNEAAQDSTQPLETTDSNQKNSQATNNSKTKPESSDVAPTKTEKKHIILAAQEDQSEKFDDESIKTFKIDKPIEEKGLVATAKKVTIAKMSAESMTEIGHTGEGLIDIDISLVNKGEKSVLIFPEESKFIVNNTDYPLAQTTTLKNKEIKKGEKVEGTLTVVLPTIEDPSAIKEIAFPWKTSTEKVVQEYDVLIVLK